MGKKPISYRQRWEKTSFYILDNKDSNQTAWTHNRYVSLFAYMSEGTFLMLNLNLFYSYLKPSRVLCALHNVNSHKKIKSYPPTDVIYRTVVTEKTRDAEKPAIHKKRPVRKKTQEKEVVNA